MKMGENGVRMGENGVKMGLEWGENGVGMKEESSLERGVVVGVDSALQ